MATNQTIESPNFEKIGKEAGQFTADAVNLLWNALNDTRATQRRDNRRAQESLEPKVITLAPAGSIDNLDLVGASVVSFVGGAANNVTGFRAPETGRSRILFCQVSQAGTMTFKHSVTSEGPNQLVNSTGADVTRTTGQGIIYAYLEGKWRQVV